MQINLTSNYQPKRPTLKKKRDRLFAQLPITSACLICNYIFTQQRGVAAINCAHLFMRKAVAWKALFHLVAVYSAVNNTLRTSSQFTLTSLQLPFTSPQQSHTHIHTWFSLIVVFSVRCKGLLGIVLTVYIWPGICSFFSEPVAKKCTRDLFSPYFPER